MRRTLLLVASVLLLVAACDDDAAWQTPDAVGSGGLGELCLSDDDCTAGLLCPPLTGVCSEAPDSDVVEPYPCDALLDIHTFEVTPEDVSALWATEEERHTIRYSVPVTGVGLGEPARLFVTAFDSGTSWPEEDGARVDFADLSDPADAGFLVLIGHDCDTEGRCDHHYAATGGRAVVSDIDWASPDGATFAGSLRTIELSEVTLDAGGVPSLVDEGCQFALETFDWSATVSE